MNRAGKIFVACFMAAIAVLLALACAGVRLV
jgi:hypothetical protein